MAEQHVNFETFDVQVPWSDIPLSDVVEEGRYVLRVREMRLAGSKEGKLMAVGFFTVDEGPLTGVNFPIQNYVLGTEEDKLCQRDPLTWKKSFGGRQLNQLIEACGTLKDDRSLRATIKRLEQARFQGYVTKSLQKEGDYAGSEQNRITKVAPYGQEMQVPGKPRGVASINGPGQQPKSRMRPSVLATGAMHQYEKDTDVDGGREQHGDPA